MLLIVWQVQIKSFISSLGHNQCTISHDKNQISIMTVDYMMKLVCPWNHENVKAASLILYSIYVAVVSHNYASNECRRKLAGSYELNKKLNGTVTDDDLQSLRRKLEEQSEEPKPKRLKQKMISLEQVSAHSDKRKWLLDVYCKEGWSIPTHSYVEYCIKAHSNQSWGLAWHPIMCHKLHWCESMYQIVTRYCSEVYVQEE